MRSAIHLLLIAGLVGLSACGDSAPEWTPGDSPKQNKVSVVKQEHVVRFAHGAAGLGPTETAELADFLGRQGGQSNGSATISVGAATGPNGIGASRERTVREALARRGYRQVDVLYTGSDTGGVNQVTIAVNRYVVTTPRCPDFSKPPEYNYANTPYSNFGCATAHNLGVMVADPADLVRGRPEGGQDGTQSVLGVQRYRTGKTTPLLKEETSSETGGK